MPESAAAGARLLRAVRWGLLPIVLGVVLAGALLGESLVTGARNAVVHTAALLGAGDLTIQPEGVRDGEAGEYVLLESGAVFSNPALMRVPGRVAGRVELRVEAGAGTRKQAVDLAGLDGPSDPQAVLLSRFLVRGRWPEAEPLGGPGQHGVVLGAGLSERLGVGPGDAIRIRAGAPGAPRTWQGRVTGVLRTGLVELDGGRMWTGLASGQELLPVDPSLRAEAATRIAVYLDRPAEAAEWTIAVRRMTLPQGTEVLTWRQANPDALPWGPWQRVQSRTGWMAFGALALVSAAGGILAGLVSRPAGTSPAWALLGPGLVGLALALALYGTLWALLRAVPLPADSVFPRLGLELNPFGDLTGPVALELGVSRALPLCLTTAGAYGAAAALGRAMAKRIRRH
jgi:hypothetical protein